VDIKTSFRGIVRKKIKNAYKENSGPLWGGDLGRYGIRVEIVRPDEYKRVYSKKECTITIYEVGQNPRGKKKWNESKNSTVLAKFTAKIRKEKGSLYYFDLSSINGKPVHKLSKSREYWKHWYRKWWVHKKGKIPNARKGKWAVENVKFLIPPDTPRSLGTRPPSPYPWWPNWKPDWRPEWIPPYFTLDFCVGKNVFEKEIAIVIPKGVKREVTSELKNKRSVYNHFYSIAFTVEAPGGLKFKSGVTSLDCHNILAHNCAAATMGHFYAHRDRIEQTKAKRNIGEITPIAGTHFGSVYWSDVAGDNIKTKQLAQRALACHIQRFGCVDYPLEVGRIAFAKTFGASTGRPLTARWTDIEPMWGECLEAFYDNPRRTLSPIVRRLIRSGWISIYFNPDVEKSDFLPWPDYRNFHIKMWEKHAQFNRYIMRKSIIIHEKVINYFLKGRRGLEKSEDKAKVNKLNKVKFGFIVTGSGKRYPIMKTAHCALFSEGRVYEIHWDKSESDPKLFDNQRFFKNSVGTPKIWKQGSGLIVVPRGQWQI